MSELVHPVEMEQKPIPQDPMSPPVNPYEEKKKKSMLIPILFIVIVLGIGTGYMLFNQFGSALLKGKTSGTQTTQSKESEKEEVEIGRAYGSPDSSTFKDDVEGVLLKGGVNGEGSHHIVRKGGESQNVFLTSSVVDLDMFVNHKVHVWGETFQAQRAGWLMDVGQVKVLELHAVLPDWVQKAAETLEKQNND